MEVLLDTNFLMLPAQFRVDIYSQLKGYEFVTLEDCIRELKMINTKESKIALELAKDVKTVKTRFIGLRGTDNKILKYALSNKCMVATNDKALIKTLKTHGIKIIRLRQNYLIEE